jgi:hypothetical protein
MYGYESSMTLTTDRLHHKLQTRPLVREGILRRTADQFSSKRKGKSKIWLSAKLVSNFEDRGWHVVSTTDPYGCNLSFLDWSHYYFLQAAPQLYSRG